MTHFLKLNRKIETNSRQSRRKSVTAFDQRLGADVTRLMLHERTLASRRLGTGHNASRISVRKKRLRKYDLQGGTTIPDVMVRNLSSPSRIEVGHVGSKSRRRVDLPLNTQGAEMRLPALPQVSLGWRWISIGLVVSLAILLYFLWTSPYFQIGKLQINGLNRLSAPILEGTLDIAGEPIFTIDRGQLEDEILAAFPEFLTAGVSVRLPNSVAITVTERIPVLAWVQESGVMLVDEKGFAFPPRDAQALTGIPQIQADSAPISLAQLVSQQVQDDPSSLLEPPTDQKAEQSSESDQTYMTPEMVRAVITLSQQAPEGAVLLYQVMRGFGWQDTRGWAVFFGTDKDMEVKLKIYQSIVERLEQEQIQPVVISVEHVHNPYYRLDQ